MAMRGRASGLATHQNVRYSSQPSILAASYSSMGIDVAKKMYARNVPNGKNDEVSITANGESNSPNVLISMKSGNTRATGGTSIASNVMMSHARRNGSLVAASTKPASV